MQETELVLVIGNKNLSSWSLRPWLLLCQAGIPFRERVLLFETPGFRTTIGELSPSSRVPLLQHGELRIWESLAICEYVAETWPAAKLWPEPPAARAHARAVSAEMHAGFAHMRRDLAMDVVLREPRRVLSTETERDVARVQAIWAECRRTYGARGPFLFGGFSVADAMFAPVVWRFLTYDVPIEDPAAREYADAMRALPAMQAWERAAEDEVRAERLTRQARPEPQAPDPGTAQHCFAVIFTSKRTAEAREAYEQDARAMVELAARQPGFLGLESARGADGIGITVSYWDSLGAIRRWKGETEHLAVQARGRAEYYERYDVRICTVDRGYRFVRGV